MGARDGLSSMVSEPLLPEQLSSVSLDPVVEPSPMTGKRFAAYLALGTLMVAVVLAGVLSIYFVVIKPKSDVDSTVAGSSGGGNTGSSGA